MDFLGTGLISIINHQGCHFQIPFPSPNLLNLILYHTTKDSVRDGSDNERWLAHPCSTVKRQCEPGNFQRVISHFLMPSIEEDLHPLSIQKTTANSGQNVAYSLTSLMSIFPILKILAKASVKHLLLMSAHKFARGLLT